jgi:chromatin remodeling complex protein RSC6
MEHKAIVPFRDKSDEMTQMVALQGNMCQDYSRYTNINIKINFRHSEGLTPKLGRSIKIMPGKANSAFMKPLKLTADLEAVVGKGPMPRSEVVKKLWAYIKKNNLQNPKNKRNIIADAKLKLVFGKGEVNMFEMTKLVSKHLS